MAASPSKPRIAILDDYQRVALTSADWSSISSRADVTVFNDTILTDSDNGDALVARLAPFEVICSMRERTKFPKDILARLPNLKLLTTTAMRNMGIDIEAAQEEGILVAGTRYRGFSTVEHNWTLIQAVARGLVQSHNETVAGNPQWQTIIPTELADKTIGILGLGNLGIETAKIAQVFRMNVIAWSPNLTQERCDAALPGVKHVSKSTLFSSSDFISIHMVSTPATKDLVSAAEFSQMKPSAFLVNTSRGPLVNEEALLEALNEGKIKGAGLDVYNVEPLPLDAPLRRAKNVTLTPHLGYVSDTTYELFWGHTAENVAAYLDRDPSKLKLMTTLEWEKSRAAKV